MIEVLTRDLYTRCIEHINYAELREPYRTPMRNCIERGMAPGDALLLVLESDLKAIFRFADLDALLCVTRWVNNELPQPIWGSSKKIRAWMTLADRCSRSKCGSRFSVAGR